MIKLPVRLCQVGNDATKATTALSGDLRLGHIPNSIDTLEPNNFLDVIPIHIRC